MAPAASAPGPTGPAEAAIPPATGQVGPETDGAAQGPGAGAEAEAPAAPTSPAELEILAADTTAASLELNGIPCVYVVQVRAHTRLNGAVLRIDLSPDASGRGAVFARGIEPLEPGASLSVSTPDLELPLELLERSSERTPTELLASLVDADGRTLASARHRLMIVPASHWCGTGFHPESLAAFVTPNSPAIAELLRDVSARLQKTTGNGALDGYLSGSPERAQRLAEACYDALAARAPVYVLLQPSFETAGQKVRTIGEVLADGLGNCLDLTLALAALLEACGLWPMVALGDDHATVAFATIDSHFPDAVQLGASRLINRLDLGEARIVESTLACAAAGGFGAALAAGERWLRSAAGELLVIDVRAARRAGFHPIAERRQRGPRRAQGSATVLEDEWKVVQPAGLPPLPKQTLSPRQRRLADWRSKLLDLTLRNRLLNDRDGAGVPLIASGDEALALLEDTLWKETPLVLKARGAMREMQEQDVADEIRAKILRSTLEDSELFKRATKVYRDGRSSLEETGARALFVAIGFLEYQAEQRSRPMRAPLILVPVEMERISRSEGFRVRAVADDTVPNVALVEFLRAAHGLDLGLGGALVEDAHGLDIRAIHARVRQAIKDVPGARVLPIAKLGIYSFKKLPLVEELRARGPALSDHALVATLLDRSPAAGLRAAELVPASAVDDVAPFAAMRLPLPADSSQIAAIASATAGASFVLQGPPGTGKSQTITNLLSECLARGKRVLFIAEKSAALSVVSDRLRKAGLGAFALDLHADHATKTHFVGQIKASLDELEARAAPHSRRFDGVAAAVDGPRLRLRAASQALHAAAEQELSVYSAIARAFRLGLEPPAGPLPTAQLDGAVGARLTEAALEERLEAARRLADAARALPAGAAEAHSGLAPERPLSAEDADRAAAAARSAGTALQTVETAAAELVGALGMAPRATLGEQRALARFAAALDSGGPRATLLAEATLGPDPERRLDGLAQALELAERGQRAGEELAAAYDRGVESLPLETLAGDLRAARAGFFLSRWLTVRRVRAALARVSKQTPPKDLPGLLARLEALSALGAARDAGLGALRELAAFAQGGPSIDFAAARAAVAAARASAKAAREGFAAELPILAAKFPLAAGAGQILPRAGALTRALAELDGALQTLAQALLSPLPLAGERGTPTELSAWLARLEAESHSLPAWSTFAVARRSAAPLGLDPVAAALLSGALGPGQAETAIEAALLCAFAQRRLREDRALADCPNERAEGLRRDFLAAVEDYRRGAANAVANAVRDRARAALEAPEPAMRQAVKQINELRALTTIRRPIRRVMAEAAPALAVLKPIVLASPLSAATLLPPDFPPFDLVVFDEASQVPVWDAACALSRAGAAVIVGDSRQLPPTNFFDRKDSEESADPEAALADALEPLQSVLEEAIAAGIPQQSLLWHYRSRDERLIEFSNRRSYGGRLQTFPAAEHQHRNLGVEFRFVRGVYDRARTSTNRAEAEAIVAEIAQRLLDRDAGPANRSIGVVTFSVAQQTLVQDLLDEALDKDPALRAALEAAAERGEPVFIKNLENVQGDERATMLFSICYGRDAAGVLHHSFGPLNLAGGERRLNVAVTRAREKVVVFSSIRAADLDPRKCHAKGVQDLRDYLAFAELGTVPSTRDEGGPPPALDIDALESALARELRSRGWKVDLHVGRSRDYRISLAVADPAAPERYLLGIELDGAFHRAAPAVVDREAVRSGVLHSLGWRTLRISAIDLLRDLPQTANRIDSALRAPR
jgi:very-short-patch-repair endonuclease